VSNQFGFEDLQIWRRAAQAAIRMFDLADGLDKKRLYRFAEQLRGAAPSISNNIAEGAGSVSKAEFRQFLNFARRSIFETANMLIIFEMKAIFDGASARPLVTELEELSRMITAFSRSLEK
jgi:four helix bundle protein